jgi:hypothetical protein
LKSHIVSMPGIEIAGELDTVGSGDKVFRTV